MELLDIIEKALIKEIRESKKDLKYFQSLDDKDSVRLADINYGRMTGLERALIILGESYREYIRD